MQCLFIYFAGSLLEKDAKPKHIPEPKAGWSMAETEKDEDEAKAYTGPVDLTTVEEKTTVWEQRYTNIKDGIRNSELFRSLRRKTREIEKSDNPAVQNIMEIKENVANKIEDVRSCRCLCRGLFSSFLIILSILLFVLIVLARHI